MDINDHAIDTNVLLVASAADPASPFKGSDHVPPSEQRQVFEWLRAFRHGKACHLVLDQHRKIINEYKRQLRENDYGRQVLDEKFRLGMCRFHRIELDEADDALLPEPLQSQVKDRADRKFVAVALQDEGRSTIVNACDTDWYDCAPALFDAGIGVTQIIDDWCRAKHIEKSKK